MASRKPLATNRIRLTCIGLALNTAIVTCASAQNDIPTCGTRTVDDQSQPLPLRSCPERTSRAYKPRFSGIGYEILDSESEACFVPDSSYQLLDTVVEQTLNRLTPAERSGSGISAGDRAIAIGKAFNATLHSLHFFVAIPTETLGDALISHSEQGQPPLYLVDCDTGSLMLLTIAEVLGVPANLVETKMASGEQHNFVRWPIGGSQFVDWDTNQAGVCTMLPGQPSFNGKAMTRAETLAYAYRLRLSMWRRDGKFSRVIEDSMVEIRGRPDNPAGYENLSGAVGYREWPGRRALYSRALAASLRAVAIQTASGSSEFMQLELANYYDTLACLYAYRRNFAKAAFFEQKAFDTYGKPNYLVRLASFRGPTRKDCTMAWGS